MSKSLNQARDRLEEFLSMYGVKVLNLIVERHHLSAEKRNWFSIRFVETDPLKEKEVTEKMEELTKMLYKVDEKLFHYGIDEKVRIQLLRDIKKVYPDSWMDGFVEEK